MSSTIKIHPVKSKSPMYLWFLFLVLFPFYVFGSGLPQPADMVMITLFAYITFYGWKPGSKFDALLVDKHLYFVILVVAINTLWAFFIDQSYEKRFPSYIHSLFYIYNFFALRTGLVLYRRFGKKILYYTAYGVGTSLILQAVLSPLLGTVTSRSALFFNNPNQLGYYALLAGSILTYSTRTIKINTFFQLVAYLSFLYLTLISSSKAALVGSIILISLSVFTQGFFKIRQLSVVLTVILIGSYIISSSPLVSGLLDYSIERFETIGASGDDTYEGRGYDRIINEPIYMLFGAGEGGYYRFDTLLSSGEIHSSFGTVIFCYGILGLLFFVKVLLAVFKNLSLFEILYFVPVLVYSFTHQGLRSTLFWVFLAIVFMLNQQQLYNKYLNFIRAKNNKSDDSANVSQHIAQRATWFHTK